MGDFRFLFYFHSMLKNVFTELKKKQILQKEKQT